MSLLNGTSVVDEQAMDWKGVIMHNITDTYVFGEISYTICGG